MSVELEERLRETLSAWADEAPSTVVPWLAPVPRSAVRPWRTRVAPALVAAALVAVVVVAVALQSPRDRGIVVGASDLVQAEVRVGDALGVRVLAVGDGAVFVASENDRRLYSVDTRTDAVLAGPALAVPDGVAVDERGVFAVLDDPVRLARLDPRTFAVREATPLDGDPQGLTVVGDRVWVTFADDDVRRFDAATLDPQGSLPQPLAPGFQRRGGAGLWRTVLDTGTVLRLDPDTGAVLDTVTIDGIARGIAVGDDAVWVADTAHDRVVRIDPATGQTVSSVAVGRFPHGLALGPHRLWVTSFEDGTLTAVDTTSDAVLTTVPIGVRPGGVALVDGSLWVSIHQEGVLRQVDPAQLEARSIRPVDEREVNVDVGGRTLFLRCMGASAAGAPTVVLEAGAGEWSEHELFLQYGLQATHRVCAYDRAGLGRSDPGPEPRTAQRITDDLALALRAADIPGPYIVVGHGFGGLYATLFAAEHRDDVAALVLVDAVSPTYLDQALPLLDDEQRAAFDEGLQDAEFAGLEESAAQVAAAPSLNDLPVVVVTGETTLRPLGERFAELWQREQRSLLALSTDSRQITAPGVSLLFPTESPGVVVDAVRSLPAG